MIEFLNECFRKQDAFRKDAIENGDTKGKWAAIGAIEILRVVREEYIKRHG